MVVNYTNILTTKTVDVAACANATTSNILNNNYVDTQFTFAVNFEESGLPPGYYWTVTVGGTQKSGSPVSSHYADIISFSLPRGSYSYRISTDNLTDLPSPASGTVKVTNSETTIPVTFNNITADRCVVAAAYGPTKDINSINTANFIGVVCQPDICDVTYPNYWLNNSALSINGINYYPLASQQFFVYQANTPVSYLKFYLEPNIVYYEQTYQGVADIFVEISTHPYSANPQNAAAFAFINISHTSGSNQLFTSSSLLENLTLKTNAQNVCLDPKGKQTTYYINFFEAVKESYGSHSSKGDGSLTFENKSTGYGYGHNEFIGTISNPSTSVNTGVSYYYEATSDATGNFAFKFFSQETCFHISSEQQVTSFSSYYFLLGYNIPSSSNTGKLIVHETGLNQTTIKSKAWQFYFGTKFYQSATNYINITGLPNAQFDYSVGPHGKYIANPESGFISIIPGKTAYLNITYFEPVGSLPNYWDISDMGIQYFTLTSSKEVNYISLYLYNFTIPPGSESGSTATNYVNINICNETGTGRPIFDQTIKVDQTGWIQVFLTSHANGYQPKTLSKGTYAIKLEDANSNGEQSFSSSIGWGFATMGGYNNYLQRVTSDTLSSQLNSNTTSVVTPYNANAPTTCDVSNQTYMYSIGYYNVTVSSEVVSYPIHVKMSVVGSLNSKGQTQFTLTKTEVLQDGIVLSAGSGVTYVTVNPLPVRIVDSSKGISLSSIAYNMSVSRGISTSVSGSGSTIVSMTMRGETNTNYTVGDSYTFDNKLGPVQSICLSNYSYYIHSTYARYWADTLFSELVGGNSENYTNFTMFNHFQFKLNGDIESINLINGHAALYSANFKSVSFSIDSI